MNYLTRLLVLSLFFVSASCYSTSQRAETTTETQETPVVDAQADFKVPETNINLTKPLVISTREDDVAMCAEINEQIDKSPYSNAH